MSLDLWLGMLNFFEVDWEINDFTDFLCSCLDSLFSYIWVDNFFSDSWRVNFFPEIWFDIVFDESSFVWLSSLFSEIWLDGFFLEQTEYRVEAVDFIIFLEVNNVESVRPGCESFNSYDCKPSSSLYRWVAMGVRDGQVREASLILFFLFSSQVLICIYFLV